MKDSVCILGSGVWGTALAVAMNNKFGRCTLFTKNPATFNSINHSNTNKGFVLDSTIKAELDLEKLNQYQNIIIASPSYSIRQVIKDLQSINLNPEVNLIISTKGLDTVKEQFLSETFKQNFKNQIMVLSGPSFADEVIAGNLTAVNLASEDEALAEKVADILSSDKFIVVPSTDVIGLQLSGIMKNILAILSGILTGLSYGENTKSAILAKGISEIKLFARTLGSNQNSSELGIIGDTLLTALSKKSRNMSFGLNLIQNPNSGHDKLVEGKLAIETLRKIAKKNGVNLQVINLAADCLSLAASKELGRLKSLIDKAFSHVVLEV
ncbi:Putative glycerol-3-phosphate dehydrogenase [Candidatus Phycorickettsia trachydisci]|uniref:Glycerol-3-phosphate dehydrogenase n=1 Tax=Candidatus Phycorickettsia trachydisci TaxID=2115978 RepID=A0A2P1P6U9_9RICK|nr:NAD(P)H-dependent glycerol-3-phosphate dehydrogenase [Candidatus Phycorickettsia trachydisci]AVP86986.1 Putative glycerol-3-phosphate dehydrogenase [Candidatus Phycorickettsia trachydisci]